MQLWEKPPPPPALPPPLTNIIIQLHPFCPPPPRSARCCGGGRRSRAWNETNFIVSPADDDKETRAIRCLCSASISRRRFERRAPPNRRHTLIAYQSARAQPLHATYWHLRAPLLPIAFSAPDNSNLQIFDLESINLFQDATVCFKFSWSQWKPVSHNDKSSSI
jgi:hypothetical protein